MLRQFTRTLTMSTPRLFSSSSRALRSASLPPIMTLSSWSIVGWVDLAIAVPAIAKNAISASTGRDRRFLISANSDGVACGGVKRACEGAAGRGGTEREASAAVDEGNNPDPAAGLRRRAHGYGS